jgi:hypothetical protein
VGASCCGQNAALLQYQGQGTNFSFTGHTAVHWAAAKGQLEALRWLLTHGASADAVNHAGSTPLHSAAGNGQVRGSSPTHTWGALVPECPSGAEG